MKVLSRGTSPAAPFTFTTMGTMANRRLPPTTTSFGSLTFSPEWPWDMCLHVFPCHAAKSRPSCRGLRSAPLISDTSKSTMRSELPRHQRRILFFSGLQNTAGLQDQPAPAESKTKAYQNEGVAKESFMGVDNENDEDAGSLLHTPTRSSHRASDRARAGAGRGFFSLRR